MQKILIIGGEGYIGNVVSEYLLMKKYEVVSFDNLLFQNNLCPLNHLHNPHYSFSYGDMCDSEALEAVLSGVDGVVLLAGLVGDPITKKYPQESAKINDQGVRNVIDTCARMNVDKFVFVSTCSNYGLIKDNELADEFFPLNPLSLYAKSKVAAEERILGLKGQTQMNPTVLRFATAFGASPRMRFDLTVNEFTRDLAMGKELLVFDEHTWRPYCHVKDFARLIHIVLEADESKTSFEVFNAGGEENNATKQMIVDTIIKRLPNSKVAYKEHGTDPRNYRVDFTKVKEVLGFEPAYSIDDGVLEIIELMGQNVFSHVEAQKNFHGNYYIEY